MTTQAAAPLAGRKEWIGLAVLLLPLLLVSMDVSVLYFAVPFISNDLHPTSTQQLWIFDVYGFVLAGLLITMGSLGDRIGRRRLLMIGAAAFGATSLAAAYAGSAEALIAARALLGIGGATLMPSTLALLRNMFHNEKQRATAVAIWTAALTFGISLGPILSGFLLEHFWWGSVFLINVPFMVLLVILAPLLIPEFRVPGRVRFDLVSSVLSLSAVLPMIYGIKEIAAHGVTPLRAGLIVAGLAVGALFLRRQQTRPDPMIDLSLFRRRVFSGSILMNLFAMFALVGFAIFTTQFIQTVLGMQPLEAALWSLAPSLGVGAAAPTAATLAKKGVNRGSIMGVGFLIALAGFAMITIVQADSPLWMLLVAAMFYASGLVVVMSLCTEMIIGAVPAERAGSASALAETCSEFGGALGMAVLGSIGTAVYRSSVADGVPAGLAPEALDSVRETLAGATMVAQATPGPRGDEVLAAAREAFATGMHAAAIGAVVIMGLAAIIAFTVLRRATVSAAATETQPELAPVG
ncbi:DHA2 family multidrug resistance protein-like MFS transporter [Allocatelliglobosispora scoriae]|uniref:DHA2 family multidrug resistance protein-like MFS transporter n=1 Tax=Allocatelliglobosispora scoriae TaxID=643052 RepID=A0A841C0Q2_9ACTN|nr:MFS transporter [Allocatelliglobosispora scoriae]MBB5872461.1 DHA2 family multidrug resistance protein-like MFS transporter [Allocatelliglobosispora scoriae]